MAAMLSRCGNFHDPSLFQKNLSALNDQRVLSRFCDVVLKVCNTEIYAHSNVLAAASPYFNSFLGVGADSPRTFCQKQPQIIEIHIDSVLIDGDGGYGEAVSKVVNYMYTSQINLTTTLVCQIIEICKIMLMDKLLDICREFQRGENDNIPKDVATCTTGLQEVLNLFNSRAKIIKRANVSTETDETLFAKLRSMSSESCYHGISSSSKSNTAFTAMLNPSNENINTARIGPISQGDIIISSDRLVQSSLIMSEDNVRSKHSFEEGNQTNTNTVNMKNQQIETFEIADNTNPDIETLITKSESLKDNDVEEVSIPSIDIRLDKTLLNNLNESISKEESIIEKRTQETEAAEIAITLDANPIHCHSLQNQSILEKPLQGRSRGRGKSKRRGRPPGRPRKVEDSCIKLIKRANVSTETDETLFAKLRSKSSESYHQGITSSSNTAFTAMLNPSNENVNTARIGPISEGDIIINSDRLVQSFLSMSEDKLRTKQHSFEEGNQINTVNKNQQIETFEIADNTNPDIETLITKSESLKDNDVEVSIPSIDIQLDKTLLNNLNESISKEEFVTEKRSQETEAAEISVVSDANAIHCHSLQNQSVSTSILEKPLRGRPRGRGKRRRRPPGRPKKVEDPASDHDFDEFMHHLEKDSKEPKEIECAQSVEHVRSLVNNATVLASKSKKDPDYVPLNVKRRLLSPIESKSPRWKSARIRSKPSFLKKDYILYSLNFKNQKPGVSSELDKPDFKRSENIVNKNQPDSLQFICQKCDFSTSVLKDYRHHLRSHPETDPRCYLCPKCGFKTTKSREYNSHCQKHMKEELICSYCEHQALTSFEYNEHMEKHSGKFPYFCTECNSRFINKNRLISHNARHQLEKPFVCVICNAGFKWRHALKNHMITHSATKDHLCDVCGFATAHKSQLKDHYLIHTGQAFKCTAQGCHFQTTKRHKLKYHMITHTHEKPHQCEICGQRFSLHKNMRRHMLLHTDTRPFACKMCSFTSTRYDKLKDHNYKLHNIGEPSVPKKVPIVDLPDPSMTSVKSVALNLDGTFSEDALQTIAQLATSQGVNTTDISLQQTISIEQPDSRGYPIIARIQYNIDDSTKLEYITSTAAPENN